MIELPRRGFIVGLGAIFAAPAIVRASSLMPVRSLTVYGRSPAMAVLPDMIQLIRDHNVLLTARLYASGA